jgi:methyl-accepting chemotaxis protein
VHITGILLWFTDPIFVWICVGFLLLLAICSAIRWWLLCQRAIVTLQGAQKALRQVNGPREFLEKYNEISEDVSNKLKRVEALNHAWDRWASTFQVFERVDGHNVVSSDRPATEYFHLSAWEKQMAMQWYRALPNYLVGLGLCFTFLGVVAVISLAAESLATSSSATSQTEALRQLLTAASTKFLTSLSGVAASVFYSWFFRWRLINVDRSISTFVIELNKRVFALNANALLLQIREQNRRQSDCLENMATNIGVAVGTQFSTATQVMSDAITALDTTMKGMSVQVGDMKVAIDNLSGGIVETTSNDLAKLVDAAVKALNTTLREHLDEVANSLKNTSVEIRSASAAFREVTETALIVREEFSTLGDEIQTRTSEVTDMLLQAETDVKEKLRGAAAAADGIQAAMSAAADSASGIDSIGNEMANAATAIRNLAEQWQTMGSDFNELTNRNGEASVTIKDAIESLSEQWENQGKRINEIDSHLAQTIGTVQQHFESYASRIRDYTTEIDKHLGDAVQSFGNTIATFTDAPERFSEAGVELQKAAQNAVTALLPLEKLNGLADSLSLIAKEWKSLKPDPKELPS